MELRQYSAVLWRWKWLLVLCTLLGGAAAYIASTLTAPVYEATTLLLINQAPDSRSFDYVTPLTSERLARTYAGLLTTRPVLEEALFRLELDEAAEDLKGVVDVQLVRGSQLIELTVEDTNPSRAATIANSIVEVFADQNDALQASRFAASKTSLSAQLDKLTEQIRAAEDQVEALYSLRAAPDLANEATIVGLDSPQTDSRRAELERRLSELTQYRVSYTNMLLSFEKLRVAEAQSFSSVVQVEPAVPPKNPVRPSTLPNILLAGVVGGMIAVGSAFLIEYMDDTIRSAEDVTRVTELPVIGYVADSKKLRDRGKGQKLTISEPNSPLAESFRSMRTNIELAGTQGTPRSILVGSPEPGDGTTTIATQLAISMAQGGKRVVLLDANLRQPRLHEYLGIRNKLGLSDMLVDDLVSQAVAQELIHWRLKVITSGKPVENPAELMGSIWMLKVLTRLREQADVAIFDGPPFLFAESFILASKLESVLIVMQAGKTREAVALRMMEQLDRAQANIIGMVMNRVPARLAQNLAGNLVYGYGADPIEASFEGDKKKPGRRPVVLRGPYVEKTGG